MRSLTYLYHGVREVHLKLRYIRSSFAERGEPYVQTVDLPLHLCPLLVQQELVEPNQLQVGLRGDVVITTLRLVVCGGRLLVRSTKSQAGHERNNTEPCS